MNLPPEPAPSHSGRSFRLRFACLGGLLGVLLTAAGCLPVSLQPWCAPTDVQPQPRLAGVYRNTPDPDSTWTFREGAETNLFALDVREDKANNSAVQVVPFLLEGRSFLDLRPDTQVLKDVHQVGDLSLMALVPGHLVFRLNWEDGALKLIPLDYDWVKDQVTEPTAPFHSLRHEAFTEGGFVLSAGTPELKKLLKAALLDAKAWGKPITLERLGRDQNPKPVSSL